MRSSRVILVLFVVLCGCNQRALACSCVNDQRACRSMSDPQYTAIFVGRVTRLFRSNGELLAELAVEESFRGVHTATVVAFNGDEDSCGFDFRPSQRYLVFASWAKGALGVSLCSPTRLVSDASDDIEYLRSYSSRGSRGWVEGTIRRDAADAGGDSDEMRPEKGAIVSVSGATVKRSTRVNSHGAFAIRNLPPGTYRVDLQLPPGITTNGFVNGSDLTIEPKSCAILSVATATDGHITGKVITPTPEHDWESVAVFALRRTPAGFGNARYPFRIVWIKPPLTEFDLPRLPAGDFIVGAYIDKAIPVTGGGKRLGYTQAIYFPGVDDLKEAAPIHLEHGGKVGSIQVQIVHTETLPEP